MTLTEELEEAGIEYEVLYDDGDALMIKLPNLGLYIRKSSYYYLETHDDDDDLAQVLYKTKAPAILMKELIKEINRLN